MSRRHTPTKATRELVKLHAMVGTPQDMIADLIEIDDKTLRKYYRRELDLSTYQANAQIGGALFNKAVKGDTSAMIFWMKTRAQWREKQEVQHSGSIDINKLSDEELEAKVRELSK
jgi:hypothetical protein